MELQCSSVNTQTGKPHQNTAIKMLFSDLIVFISTKHDSVTYLVSASVSNSQLD